MEKEKALLLLVSAFTWLLWLFQELIACKAASIASRASMTNRRLINTSPRLIILIKCETTRRPPAATSNAISVENCLRILTRFAITNPCITRAKNKLCTTFFVLFFLPYLFCLAWSRYRFFPFCLLNLSCSVRNLQLKMSQKNLE